MLDTHARKYIQPIIDRTATFLLHLGMTANFVTKTAFAAGVSAGLLCYLNHVILAVILLWSSGYLDAVDGSMARKQGTTSPWGTLMDITFDRIVELAIIVALALRYSYAQFSLLLLTCTIVFSMTVFLTVGALTEKKGIKSFYYQAGLAERTEGFILFTLMMLVPQMLLWTIWLFLFVVTITGLQRIWEAKQILKSGFSNYEEEKAMRG